MKRLTLFICLAFAGLFASADETDLAAVSSLKIDLDTVVELGVVNPVDGVTTAGQPDEAGFKVFAEMGYAAVIDLRTEGEDRGLDEPSVVADLGMDYINLPIGRDGITFANAKALEDAIASYDEPVLVHCGSANRVGALFALSEYSKSEDLEKALEAGKAAGLTRMEGAVKKAIGVE
ncbi:MAG: sulfur transferase domain-containing protein [Gammaproteobacteria bacterium]|nr:sulfur transferase domain-containing protein [Gammaproteobacteria bacterium]